MSEVLEQICFVVVVILIWTAVMLLRSYIRFRKRLKKYSVMLDEELKKRSVMLDEELELSGSGKLDPDLSLNLDFVAEGEFEE